MLEVWKARKEKLWIRVFFHLSQDFRNWKNSNFYLKSIECSSFFHSKILSVAKKLMMKSWMNLQLNFVNTNKIFIYFAWVLLREIILQITAIKNYVMGFDIIWRSCIILLWISGSKINFEENRFIKNSIISSTTISMQVKTEMKKVFKEIPIFISY